MKSFITRAQRLILLSAAAACLMSGMLLPTSFESLSISLALAAQSTVPCIQCVPIEGGQFFSVPGKEVKVTIMSSVTAPGVTNLIYLSSPGPRTFIGTSRDVGKTVCLGPFPPSAELIFELDPTGTLPDGTPIPPGPYFTGPGLRNTDGLTHASVACLSGNQAGKATIGFEDLPGLPPSSDRDFNDVVIELSRCDGKCDTIGFRSPQYFLNSLHRLPRGAVLIGGVNFNAPVSTNNVEAMREALLGGGLFGASGNPLQQFNRQFVAAQLSMELAGGSGSAPVFNALWARLGCPGLFGNFDPIRLSNGVFLTPDSVLNDLFTQARLAIQQNRIIDLIVLGGFLDGLGCDDDLPGFPSPGKCLPSTPRPDLIVFQATCLGVGSTRMLLVQVQNNGHATAPAGILVHVLRNEVVVMSKPTMFSLAPMSGAENLVFEVLPCAGDCFYSVVVDPTNSVAEEKEFNNAKIMVDCP